MPQLNQLSDVALSQFLWLAIGLAFIFFVIARNMVPKIQGTVDARDKKIADDLERAQAARAKAEETEAAWRARMDQARAEAARLTQEAKQESARATEAKARKAGDEVALKVESAESKIREAVAAARAEIEAVAAEATQEMVSRLAGINVDKKDAAAAVKAEMTHG